MPDQICLELQRHLTQLDYIRLFSLYVKGLVETEDLEQLDDCMLNRGRLINLTSETQKRIENQVRDLKGRPELASLLNCWSEDTLRAIADIEKIDQEISMMLDELKSQTTKQISHLFRSRESFKGYNLTTTKR